MRYAKAAAGLSVAVAGVAFYKAYRYYMLEIEEMHHSAAQLKQDCPAGKDCSDEKHRVLTPEFFEKVYQSDPFLESLSWSEELEKYEVEKLQSVNTCLSEAPRDSSPHNLDEIELKNVWNVQRPSPSKRFAHGESPSVASEAHSEISNDSGTGGSCTGERGLLCSSSMTPVEEEENLLPLYEFEIPQDLVGLLIGQKGRTIRTLMDSSGTHIVIRDHYYNPANKICTIEGTRDQINRCLRMIRIRFPSHRFPELPLTPVLNVSTSNSNTPTPVLDSIVQLSLPETVRCEVILSSTVSTGHFFLQQPTHPTYPNLVRLDEYMLAVYGQNATPIPELPRPVEGGVICAAPVQGGWYRAQTILYDAETDECVVKFVDYGGYSKLTAADLRQIRSDFMSLPFQASECYLAHVKPVNPEEGWTSDVTAVFEELAHGKVLECEIVGRASNGNPYVDLYICSPNGESILLSRVLSESQLAEWTDDVA